MHGPPVPTGRAFAGALLVAASVAGPVRADTVRIMPLGDSITQGSGACSYRTPLVRSLEAAGCPVRMVGSGTTTNGGASGCIVSNTNHEGHSGWRTTTFLRTDDDARTRLEEHVAGARPDIVLLHIGSNDMNGGKDPGTWDADARTGTGVVGGVDTMIDQILAESPGARVYVANLVPWLRDPAVDADVARLRAEVERLALTREGDGEAVRLVDVAGGFTADMLHDGVHPNARGDAHIASRWLGAMRADGLCGGGDGDAELPAPTRAEAESGNVVGAMRIVADAAASGGLYAGYVGSGSSAALVDTVEIAVSAPRDGTYRLLARVRGTTADENSFFVALQP